MLQRMAKTIQLAMFPHAIPKQALNGSDRNTASPIPQKVLRLSPVSAAWLQPQSTFPLPTCSLSYPALSMRPPDKADWSQGSFRKDTCILYAGLDHMNVSSSPLGPAMGPWIVLTKLRGRYQAGYGTQIGHLGGFQANYCVAGHFHGRSMNHAAMAVFLPSIKCSAWCTRTNFVPKKIARDI